MIRNYAMYFLILVGLVVANFFYPSGALRMLIVYVIGFALMISLLLAISWVPVWLKKRKMSPEEWRAFVAAEEENQRLKDNQEREQQYLDAIAGPRKWCLMAMREGRNYTRQDVADKDIDDVLDWAKSNDIAVTVMDRNGIDAKLSFGELRRAKKTARFMGEPV